MYRPLHWNVIYKRTGLSGQLSRDLLGHQLRLTPEPELLWRQGPFARLRQLAPVCFPLPVLNFQYYKPGLLRE